MSTYFASPSRPSAGLSSSPSSPTPLLSSLNDTDGSVVAHSPLGYDPRYTLSNGPHQTNNSNRSLRKTRTIVVLGFSMVGKTALCVRFVNDRFDESYEPTYTNSFVKIVQPQNQKSSSSTPIEIVIKDTQGVSEQEVFRPEYGLGVHGYLLVYSIASMRSFDVVKAINAKLINLIGNSHVPRILIGNKSDLQVGGTELRQVPYELGAALAEKWGCPFTECSAKQNINIDRAFTMLLDEIERATEPEQSTLETSLERLKDCFAWCRTTCNFGSAASDASASSSIASPAQLAAATEAWTLRTKIAAASVTILAIAAIAYAVYIGVHFNNSEFELLTYVLFGFSFILFLVSLVGLYGLRIASIEFLRVYTISLCIMIVCELIVWILLYINIEVFSDHTIFVVITGLIAIIIQSCAAIAGRRLQQTMKENQIGSPTQQRYNTEYHQSASYHSLYE